MYILLSNTKRIPRDTKVYIIKDTKGYLPMKQLILSNVASINSKRLAMNILGDQYVLKIANKFGISLTGATTRAFAIGFTKG